MINLETFFENHFNATSYISDNKLRSFSEDHITKLSLWLTTHADAELSQLLNELVAKHTAYYGNIDSEGAKLNLQISRTIEAEQAWEAVLGFIHQAEGAIIYKWGKDSGVFREFYPHGLTEYDNATNVEKLSLLVQFLTAANAHVADLPPNFVMDFTVLKDAYTSKYAAQQTQIGAVKQANSNTASSREEVEVQLSKNIMAIGFRNIGHPEMVNDFFTQSLIRRNRSIPAHTVIIRGIVTTGISTPVAGATVSVQAPNTTVETTQTGTDGRYQFTFNDVPDWIEGVDATFTVDAAGYAPYEQLVRVELGKITVVNASLAAGALKVA